jgi:hypothetical protein
MPSFSPLPGFAFRRTGPTVTDQPVDTAEGPHHGLDDKIKHEAEEAVGMGKEFVGDALSSSDRGPRPRTVVRWQ